MSMSSLPTPYESLIARLREAERIANHWAQKNEDAREVSVLVSGVADELAEMNRAAEQMMDALLPLVQRAMDEQEDKEEQ